MAAGFSAPLNSQGICTKLYSWLFRNRSMLFTLDIVWILLLFFLHLFTITFHIFTEEIVNVVQIVATILAALIILSVVSKGSIPLIICALGIVLMHNSIILPFYSTAPRTEQIISPASNVMFNQYPTQVVWVASNMHFLLGFIVVTFSIMIFYRPSILFTRNRPKSLESEWCKYPVWDDRMLSADGKHRSSMPIRSLMTDEDKYLLWRYEFLLANISGIPHLVRPEAMVPIGSSLFRDKESDRLIGKSRYSGFFI